MKKLLVYIMLTGVLATFAAADFPRAAQELNPVLPGEMMTVKVDSLPPDTESAALSLGGTVYGLLMKKQPDGSWVGRFAVLPDMAGKVLTPVVTARMKDGTDETVALAPRPVELIGQVKDGDGFLTQSDDGAVVFVFDKTIRLSTVEVTTTEGIITTPDYENNYFRLPAGIALNDVLEVNAESIHGENLRISPSASLQASR